MTKAIVAIRPEPGLSRTKQAAATVGLEIVGAPLFEVEPLLWAAPEPQIYDALLVGSTSVFAHGGDQLADLKRLPVLAVGRTTAEAAEASGFSVSQVGEGGLQRVLDALPTGMRRLLRIGGEERVPLEAPQGVVIDDRVAYRMNALPIPDKLTATLRKEAVVLLHSAAAARHFAQECDRLEIARNALTLATLGPRISEAAGESWGAIHTAESPSDAALLAMIQRLCL